MPKTYNEKISKHTDWGGDASTGGLPVCGGRVQEFIKGALEQKVGCIHYDATSNRFLAFADDESRDRWIGGDADSTLVLGAFDAPFNYEASITLESPQVVAVAQGEQGVRLCYTFSVVNKQGSPTGEGVTATYTFVNGARRRSVTHRYAYGERVQLTVDDYLEGGTNQVIIAVTGSETFASTSVSVSIVVVDLRLTTDFDFSAAVTYGATSVAVGYLLEGEGTKTMEWYVDSEPVTLMPATDVITESRTQRVRYLSVEGLAPGVHSLQCRAWVDVGGERFYTPTLYRDFFVWHPSLTAGALLLGLTLERGTLAPANRQSSPRCVSACPFEPYVVAMAMTSASGEASAVATLSVGGERFQSVTLTASSVVDVPLVFTTPGLRVFTPEMAGAVLGRTFEIEVARSASSIEENHEGLRLMLDASGRSNSEPHPDVWTSGDVTTMFRGFAWNARSGWDGKALHIPQGCVVDVDYAPLIANPTQRGVTLEFYFATQRVADDDAPVCSLMSASGVGVLITASEVCLCSRSGTRLSTRFRPEETVHVAVVINRAEGVNDARLAFIYVNGIRSAAARYGVADSFATAAKLHFEGTEAAELCVRYVRVYERALTADEVLSDYMLYMADAAATGAVYARNEVYLPQSATLSPDALAAWLPVMVITGDVPALEATTDKRLAITVDVNYTDLQRPELSFVMRNATLTPQGTSSMGYPKKNFRLYTQRRDDTLLLDASGNEVVERLYSFRPGGAPVACWCLKADYAESSGAHNTGVARLWNDVLTRAQIDGDYLLRTDPQQYARDHGYPYDVRTTIDGFPIALFYRATATSAPVFIGKYNFNNDKSTEQVFGFCDIPGFDNSAVECWEVLNNGHALALMTTVEGFDEHWDEAYESRYPDGSDNTTRLRRLVEWVASLAGLGEEGAVRFATEKWYYIDIPKVAAYYVYLFRFAAVDQFVKNSMLTTFDGEHWSFILYDNDTVCGLRNDGRLIYGPETDRETLDDTFATPVYAFAGHESALWRLLLGDEEFCSMVRRVDDALYHAGLTYESVVAALGQEQSGRWCERVFNADSQYKYVGPCIDRDVDNLFMLQGSRESHRRWWLARRFAMVDALWVTGAYRSHVVELKVAGATAGVTFTIEAQRPMWFGYGVNNVVVSSGVALQAAEEHTFVTEQTLNIGDPLRLYAAPYLRSVDLRGFVEHMAVLNLEGAWSATLGTSLRQLLVGVDVRSDSRRNRSLSAIGGLRRMERLEVLDIGGCEGIATLDLSGQPVMRQLRAMGSGLSVLTLAEGAPIELLELPRTMTSLTLRGLPDLTREGLVLESLASVADIRVEASPHLTGAEGWSLVREWLAVKQTPDGECSLTMTGIEWRDVSPDELLSLGRIPSLTLKGRIALASASQQVVDSLQTLFGPFCFEPTSALWITGPEGVYLAGPSTVLEGEEARFSTVVFTPDGERYTLVKSATGTDPYTTFDEATDRVTTAESGVERSITLIYRVVFASGREVSVTRTLQVRPRVFPEQVEVAGPDVADSDVELTLRIVSPEVSSIDGSWLSHWSIYGPAVDAGVVGIDWQRQWECRVKFLLPASQGAMLTFTVRCEVVRRASGMVSAIGEHTLTVRDPSVVMTADSNPVFMAYCHAEGWAQSPQVMTLQEAAAVTTLTRSSGCSLEDVESLNELGVFVALTSIPDSFFNACSRLQTVTLPPMVTSVGASAFNGCTSLVSVVMPEGIRNIGDMAFAYCTSIEEIHFPSTAVLGSMVLRGCTSLKVLEVPPATTALSGVCRGCSSLKQVTLPSTLVSLSDWSFAACPQLTTIISLQPTAPDTATGCFGSSGNGNNQFTGYASRNDGINRLIVPEGAVGYDQELWSNPLQTSCGFTIVYSSDII